MIAMTTSVHSFTGDQLFQITPTEAIVGNFARADLKFSARKLPSGRLAGRGIYACFFDDALIYIGKFLGTRNDPFGGNVLAARWVKHVATLTLRGQKISFSPYSQKQILAHGRTDAPWTEMAQAHPGTLLRDRGCLSTHNRFLFGAEHWAVFDRLAEADLGRFSFTYVQLRPEDERPATADVRAHVSRSEDAMVRLFQPRANAVTPPSTTHLLTRKMAVIEALQESLSSPIIQAQELPAINSAPISIAPQKKVATPLVQRTTEPEETSAHAMWLARMEGAPQAAFDLIDKIHERFDRDDLEVHYKFVPDLRLRSRNKHGKLGTVGQNFARFRWRQQTNSFLVDIGLPASVLSGYGLFCARPNRHGPLETLLELWPDQYADDADLILECLEDAHLRMIGDAGRASLRRTAAE